MNEPIYNFKHVPRARRGLEGSVVVEVRRRDTWINLLGEVLLLCNEAASRRKASQYVPPGHRGKPLSLEYIADRFDLDDPLRGYCVRSEVEGWLQGFVTVTDFTTWQSWFRWDSLRRDAEITDESIDYLHDADDETETRDWMKQRVRDLDGRIAWELSQQVHDGDNEQEGVVWPRIAEVSLLAGMGCGSWLLQLVIDELEAPGGKYQWIVLQASENAVSFYERFGFVRVGAVARYDPHKPRKESKEKDKVTFASDEDISSSEDEEQGEESSSDDDSNDNDSDEDEDDSNTNSSSSSGSSSDASSGDDDSSDGSSGSSDDSSSDSDGGSSMDDSGSDNDENNEVLDPREQRALRRRLLLQQQAAAAELDESENTSLEPSSPGASSPSHSSAVDHPSALDSCTDKESNSSDAPPEIKGICSDFFWYRAKDDETPNSIARKFRVDVHDLLFINARVIQLAPGNKLYGGTYLRVPKHGKPYDATVVFSRATLGDESSGGKAMSATGGQIPGVVPPLGVSPYYFALNDETPEEIASKIGVDVKDLVALNKPNFKGLLRKSKLLENTKLMIPGRELTEEEKQNKDLPPIVPYRHWTFQDDKVEFTPPSFMMARRIVRRKRIDGPTHAEQLLAQKKVDEPPIISDQRGKSAESANLSVEDFDEGEITAMFVAAKAKAEAEHKAEDDRLNAEAHIPIKVKFNFAGSKLKLDRVGPLQAEVPTSVWEDSNNLMDDTESSSIDADATSIGKKRARLDNKAVVNTRSVKVLLNRCAKELEEFERISDELYPDPDKPKSEILRPPEPEKPRGRTSCYMYFNNEMRPLLAKKHPDLKVTDIAKMVSAEWKKLTDAQKAPYIAKSKIDKIRWSAEYKKYKKKMEAHEKLMLKLFPPKPKKKKLIGGAYMKDKSKAMPMLINKVPCGVFGGEKNGIARGRLRWKLVEEGRALELDISAKRCTIVKTRVMRGTPNADMEEWDIVEDASSELFGMGGSVYKNVETSLLAPLLREKTLGSPCRNGDAILSSSAIASAKASPKSLVASNLKSDSTEVPTKRPFKVEKPNAACVPEGADSAGKKQRLLKE
eukprot:g890.t1